jgi:hypothetical protein
MNRKRPLPVSEALITDQRCFFCETRPVVLIEYTNSKRKRTDKRDNNNNNTNNNNTHLKPPPHQPLCLLHFYTTNACRHVTASGYMNVSQQEQNTIATVIDSIALQQQLPRQQELFAEAYLQIQQEIQDVLQQQNQEPVEASTDQNRSDDPLAIITALNQGGYSHKSRSGTSSYQPYDNIKSLLPRMKKVKPPNVFPEGGFLRHVPTPERIVQVQQQQIQQQQALIDRMNESTDTDAAVTKRKAVTSTNGTVDVTQRRKPTRTNVWNIISHEDRTHAATTSSSSSSNDPTTILDASVVCSCGSSTSVEVLSSNTNKSQDMTKAETWGNKDRHDEIINRYLCHHCGKSWNDVE